MTNKKPNKAEYFIDQISCIHAEIESLQDSIEKIQHDEKCECDSCVLCHDCFNPNCKCDEWRISE
jgi:hypothetical protein